MSRGTTVLPGGRRDRGRAEKVPWKCPTCSGTEWWRHYPLEPWYCAACVPPVLEPHEVEWREEPVAALASADEFDEVHDA